MLKLATVGDHELFTFDKRLERGMLENIVGLQDAACIPEEKSFKT